MLVIYIITSDAENAKKYLNKNQKDETPEFSFPQITLHELRHFNISLLLENGIVL